MSNQAAPSTGTRVFLSYSNVDRARVEGLERLLTLFGHAVFMAHRTIQLGADWKRELEAALTRTDVVLVFWTKAASRSDWVRKEYEFFLGRASDKPLVPIRGDETELSPLLANRQSLDFATVVNRLLQVQREMRSRGASRSATRKEMIRQLSEEGVEIGPSDQRRVLRLFGVVGWLGWLAGPFTFLQRCWRTTVDAAAGLNGVQVAMGVTAAVAFGAASFGVGNQLVDRIGGTPAAPTGPELEPLRLEQRDAAGSWTPLGDRVLSPGEVVAIRASSGSVEELASVSAAAAEDAEVEFAGLRPVDAATAEPEDVASYDLTGPAYLDVRVRARGGDWKTHTVRLSPPAERPPPEPTASYSLGDGAWTPLSAETALSVPVAGATLHLRVTGRLETALTLQPEPTPPAIRVDEITPEEAREYIAAGGSVTSFGAGDASRYLRLRASVWSDAVSSRIVKCSTAEPATPPPPAPVQPTITLLLQSRPGSRRPLEQIPEPQAGTDVGRVLVAQVEIDGQAHYAFLDLDAIVSEQPEPVVPPLAPPKVTIDATYQPEGSSERPGGTRAREDMGGRPAITFTGTSDVPVERLYVNGVEQRATVDPRTRRDFDASVPYEPDKTWNVELVHTDGRRTKAVVLTVPVEAPAPERQALQLRVWNLLAVSDKGQITRVSIAVGPGKDEHRPKSRRRLIQPGASDVITVPDGSDVFIWPDKITVSTE